MSDLAVRVEGIGKYFHLRGAPNTSISDALFGELNRWRNVGVGVARDLAHGHRPKPGRYLPDSAGSDFWALRDVFFDLRYGEVMGIIGANGAGKSTLLKILSQVIPPTEGRAELYGRVGALLEVGTGFNPELSGRENIYLYGSILGMTRADIAKRFDEIVTFAEIGRFLNQPIKHYSSGMHSRLAFSVAAHLECDILLVDEVLAVGDAAFRNKCLGKMQDLTGHGRAVIFVSHNMAAVNNMCDRAIVLKSGEICFRGPTQDATREYMKSIMLPSLEERRNPLILDADPNSDAKIRRVLLHDGDDRAVTNFEKSKPIHIATDFDINVSSVDYSISIKMHDMQGLFIARFIDDEEAPSILCGVPPGSYQMRTALPKNIFRPGQYAINISIVKRNVGSVNKLSKSIVVSIIDTKSHDAMRPVEKRRHIISPVLDWNFISKSTEM